MNLLEGAEFTLTRDGADLGTYSTDPGGTVTLPMFTVGTYGSTGGLPGADGADPIEGGGRDHHRCAPPGASGTSFWKLTGSGGAYTLTVTNAIDYELPSVGGPGIYLSMLLGTAAMCAAGLFFATQIAGNGAGRGKGRYRPKRLQSNDFRKYN